MYQKTIEGGKRERRRRRKRKRKGGKKVKKENVGDIFLLYPTSFCNDLREYNTKNANDKMKEVENMDQGERKYKLLLKKNTVI